MARVGADRILWHAGTVPFGDSDARGPSQELAQSKVDITGRLE